MRTISKTNSKKIINSIKKQNEIDKNTVCLGTYGIDNGKSIDLTLKTKPTLREGLSIVNNIVSDFTNENDDDISFIFVNFLLFVNYLDILTNLDTSSLGLEDFWKLYMYTDLREKIFSSLEATLVHYEIQTLVDEQLKFAQSKCISNVQNKANSILQEFEKYANTLEFIEKHLTGVDANNINEAMNLIINGDFNKKLNKIGVNENDKNKSR